jgi:hypothetical protein
MEYKVRTHELCWYNCCYIVEADSEEEVRDLVESGEGNIIYSDYDTTDQVDIESIEEI